MLRDQQVLKVPQVLLVLQVHKVQLEQLGLQEQRVLQVLREPKA